MNQHEATLRVNLLEPSDTLAKTLAGIDAELLQGLIECSDRSQLGPHTLLACKLRSAATQDAEFTTTLPEMKQFVERVIYFVCIEKMRRSGFIEVDNFPTSILDEREMTIRSTEAGLKELERLERLHKN